ncbi:MAG: inverse autotransporter beta domain-containing protein, partial [Deltaproteobacteria bacterium]|nr:inverse autotransporter beta domain-containing protein [Deltaproteobacteria bacterium]
KDYDGRYVQERPAEGWDAKLTGYLPFYKQLALNAAMEEWFGEMVSPFGQADRLTSNPRVWVMGLSWTPVPLFSFTGETRTAKTHTETKLGLSLNYFFGVPLVDQLTASNVTELRSVDGSRHDFVNRQNDMILQYRAKPGTYLVRAINMGNNVFKIVITDYFGNPAKGVQVKVSS